MSHVRMVMPRIFTIALCLIITVMFLSSLTFAEAPATGDKNTQQAVSYLMDVVANSHLTFIRNGKKYSGEEAAKHMMDKYKYYKSQVESPEDFIRLCASKSLLSGKPYLVETADGVVPTRQWLTQILAQYRRGW